jgi:hypothetical protein
MNLDKRRVGQRRGKVLGMIEADRTVIPSSQDQRRLRDVAADISRSPKIDQETPTGLTAQQKLDDLPDICAKLPHRHFTVESGEVLKNAGKVPLRVPVQQIVQRAPRHALDSGCERCVRELAASWIRPRAKAGRAQQDHPLHELRIKCSQSQRRSGTKGNADDGQVGQTQQAAQSCQANGKLRRRWSSGNACSAISRGGR